MTDQQQTETVPPPPIVWVDTETTRADHRRVPWEVGLIRRAPDGTESVHHWWLPPGPLDAADGFALRVGGFWDRHPLGLEATGAWDRELLGSYFDAVTPHERFAPDVLALTHDAVWVGTNPSFDAEPIAAILRQQRLLPTWRYDLCDVIVLACGWLHGRAAAGEGPGRPPVKRRSDDIAKLLGVEVPPLERHTAQGDARRDQRIYDIVTGRVPAPMVAS